jgi:hypothetical protein
MTGLQSAPIAWKVQDSRISFLFMLPGKGLDDAEKTPAVSVFQRNSPAFLFTLSLGSETILIGEAATRPKRGGDQGICRPRAAAASEPRRGRTRSSRPKAFCSTNLPKPRREHSATCMTSGARLRRVFRFPRGTADKPSSRDTILYASATAAPAMNPVSLPLSS